MQSKEYSFEDFISIALNKNKLPKKRLEELIESISNNSSIQTFSNFSPTAFYIFDFSKMHYIFISESIINLTGYPSDIWLNKGIKFAFENYHPKDLSSIEIIHKEIFKHSHSIHVKEKKEYKYTYDYRTKNSSGVYIRILLQCVVVEIDKDGKPILSLCQMTDITEYKTKNLISLVISKRDKKTGQYIVVKKDFYPLLNKKGISPRQLEVLRLISEGCNNEQVAKKLDISIHTVKDHRRNMIKNCKVKNITELVRMAIENGIF